MKISRIQQALSGGRPAFGICVMWPAPGIIEAVGGAWDFIWIDAQHGMHDYGSLAECIRACDLAGTSALVRVPGHAYDLIGPVLDLAPAGIIAPMVNDPSEARHLVECVRFAPLGMRSFGGRRIIDLYGRDYVREANRCQLLVVQIETSRAVQNAEAIAAVEGLDAVFFGPDDLRVSLGLGMDAPLTEPPLSDMAGRVAAAARKAGKFAMVPVGTAEAIRWVLKAGFSGCVVGSDVGFVKGGSAAALRLAEELGC